MCGIAGAYRPVGQPVCDEKVLVAMRDRMVHRGPDGGDTWRAPDGRCGLAHRRLSIIDLSIAATQPMANAAGSVHLVFNGEIYNHAELRRELSALGRYTWATNHSDTEVLLHAFEEWGVACFERFYGMFAVAVYDQRNPHAPVLHLARDRLGVKPLYFSRTSQGEWLFASEIRALFAHPALTPEMDRPAFWHYLTFIVTPAPMTLFKGVFKLPAGHLITIDHNGQASARKWWDCVPSAQRTLTEAELSEPDAIEKLTELLKKSIERRMVSDVPFGVLLSGGVDSSMNVALMSELMDRPVTTFTIGYEGEEQTNEFGYARRVAQRYRTDHHETLISRKDAQDFLPLLVQLQDEPIADNVCIPLYFLSKLVKESGTTVVQVGEGADENLLGYWWVDHYRRKYDSVYAPARRGGSGLPWWRRLAARGKAAASISGEDLEIQRRAAAGQELFWGGATCWWGDMRNNLTPHPERFKGVVDCPVPGLMPPSFAQTDSSAVVDHYLGGLTGTLAEPEVLQKISYMELKLRLPEHLLMRVDKLTMAHSIEARVPFLDHDLVEFAMRLPLSYKQRGGVGKYLLKRAAEPYLDHDMIYRKKQGFGAPMEAWFKEPEFARRCSAAFERSRLRKDGLLDGDYFNGLLRQQTSGSGGYSFHLWTVLNAVLWHESWIEGRADCF
jgi:asparagine synthase (glutamine-hydrolysing)